MLLHGQQTIRQLRFPGRPAFSIHAYCRVNLVECLADGIHGLDVMNPHQVKTESVYVILSGPIADRLYHETPHHRPFAGRFIATTRCVGPFPFLVRAIEITWYGPFKIASFRDSRVIIHHVHHHPDTCPVKRHDHLLELADTHFGLIRVGGIRTFRHVVVFRVISPVVLRFVELGFVHRRKVERRQQLYVCHAQLLQMVNTRFLAQIGMRSFLRQSQELSSVPDAGDGIDREITMVQFINHHVGETFQRRTLVFVPAFRIRLLPVDNGCTVAVHSHSLCHESGCISLPHIVYLDIECIEFSFQVFVHVSLPHAIGYRFHLHHAVGRTSLSFFIQQHPHFLSRRSPKREPG